MASFSKVLLALDLESCSGSLIDRVRQTCLDESGVLHVVHVIRKGMHNVTELHGEQSFAPHARRETDHLLLRLRDLLCSHDLNIPSANLHLRYGEPAAEIKRLAEELQVDLLVVGSQTKGEQWLPLPGPTTNCVLQGSTADVMAIRV